VNCFMFSVCEFIFLAFRRLKRRNKKENVRLGGGALIITPDFLRYISKR